ncbi:T9SS type A sorting domain-containing protein [Winogradskyella sp. PG-2]|uniref:T9SS type A sorting domain-containing protein n=1 Tax=Winogradskyella sp. PG-2 TaxID=754409 RepID=UPI00045865D0|nr:T9SS type A sorting domain-containing protein [Winogradskyella sp. PG-2]BAO76060.1 hypothetical protein WPG_1830 [Winogradskyella sp. PG-2]
MATTSEFIYSQCERSGSFVQSDPAYSISGTGEILFESNGDKNVVFENDFMTVQGADLRVYISKKDDIATSGSDAVQISGQLENDAGGFGGPGTSPITGMMTFPITTDTNLSDYDFIVIQCIAINERWGHITLGVNTGSDCALLNVSERRLENSIKLYPNPAKDNLNIENINQLDLNIKIYNVLGKEVYSSNNSTSINHNINSSSLKTGVYLVSLTADNQTVMKRLIKE